MSIATTNPATGEVVRTFKALTESELETKLGLAADASAKHKRTSFAQRADRMRAAAEIVENEKRRFGELMTLEMGKPIAAAVAEAEKCAAIFAKSRHPRKVRATTRPSVVAPSAASTAAAVGSNKM